MKNQITAILILCGALLASASPASAFTRGDNAGELCFFTHCWSQGNGSQTWGVASVETPTHLQSDEPADDLASDEFGGCLLNDEPIKLEQLVDCRSDACLGRKFYYGRVGTGGR